jgi:hypothetical protein
MMADCHRVKGHSVRSAGIVAILVAPGLLGGCAAGSLATSTGPRQDGEWSVAPEQPVHTGETVRFSFVMVDPFLRQVVDQPGAADYCLFEFGGDKEAIEPEPGGGFRTEYTFDEIVAGDLVKVQATAYRERGPRDGVKIGDSWVENLSPHNEPDERVAGASVTLACYQSEVKIELPSSADGYDFTTGKLTLYREGSPGVPIYQKRPPRGGFEVVPGSGGAGWWVMYRPSGDEVNTFGETRVEFSVYDRVGNRRVFQDVMDTP